MLEAGITEGGSGLVLLWSPHLQAGLTDMKDAVGNEVKERDLLSEEERAGQCPPTASPSGSFKQLVPEV